MLVLNSQQRKQGLFNREQGNGARYQEGRSQQGNLDQPTTDRDLLPLIARHDPTAKYVFVDLMAYAPGALVCWIWMVAYAVKLFHAWHISGDLEIRHGDYALNITNE